jgi:hypothetical protein
MVNHEDFCTRGEKQLSKLDVSRSFICIFMVNHEDFCTRSEKQSSKLDVSRSFICIFAK